MNNDESRKRTKLDANQKCAICLEGSLGIIA